MSLHRIKEHPQFVEGCFGCKVGTLQLNAGDAHSDRIASGWTEKKWDKELALYRSARAQGIQPNTTRTKDIRQALDVSDKTGYAFGSDL